MFNTLPNIHPKDHDFRYPKHVLLYVNTSYTSILVFQNGFLKTLSFCKKSSEIWLLYAKKTSIINKKRQQTNVQIPAFIVFTLPCLLRIHKNSD